jgi:hypothetical protein
MTSFQNSRDAATNAPAPATKNPSADLRLDAAEPQTKRHIPHSHRAFARQPVERRITFLINGQIIRIHRKQLKTNNRGRF